MNCFYDIMFRMRAWKLPRRYPWIIPTIVFAVLVAVGASMHPLWGDEAETALFARNINRYGVPKGWDGVNIMGHDNGIVLNGNLVNHSSPWLQYYLVAASFRLIGESAFAARLPFILAAVATVPLVFYLAVTLTGISRVGIIAAWTLALSVPYILFAYQARYYSVVALAGLVCILSGMKLGQKGHREKLIFIASGIIFFYANYIIFTTFCVAAAVGLLVYHNIIGSPRKTIRSFLLWFLLSTIAILAIGSIWFIALSPQAKSMITPPADVWSFSVGVFERFKEAFQDYSENNALPFLFFPVVLYLLFRAQRQVRSALWLMGTLTTVFFLLLSIGSAYTETVTILTRIRYTMVMYGLLVCVSSIVLDRVLARNIWVGLLCIAVYMGSTALTFTRPRILLAHFLSEASNPYQTPDEAVAAYLVAHARDGDTAYLNLDRNYEPLIFLLKDKIRFINRVRGTNTALFPKNRSVLPRYVYDYPDGPDWVILYGKGPPDNSFFMTDWMPLPRGIDLARDYTETVLPIFFSDLSRPELFVHSFEKITPDYRDQIFIYQKKKTL